MDDTFTLYDLKVEVVASDRPMVCSHKVGDYFLVQGENLVFQKDTSFSMYSLSALLPLLPASSGHWIPMTGCFPTQKSPAPIPTAEHGLRSQGSENGSRAMGSVR